MRKPTGKSPWKDLGDGFYLSSDGLLHVEMVEFRWAIELKMGPVTDEEIFEAFQVYAQKKGLPIVAVDANHVPHPLDVRRKGGRA